MATAKKPARKAPVKKTKSVSAKATKKTVSKKTVAKAEVTAPKTKTRSAFDVIYDFLRGSILVYAAVAAAVVVFVTMPASKIVLTVQAPDLLADTSGKVLAPASEVLFNLQPQHLLAVMFGLSAVGSLLLATRLKRMYKAGVDNKTSGLRWLIIGITGGISLQFVSLLSGITDAATLKMTAGLVLATVLLSWLAERENAVAGKTKWLAYVSSLVVGVMAWLAVIGSLLGTLIYGSQNFAWYVYAISGVVLLGFIGFAITQYRQIKGLTGDYMSAEQNYWRIDFLYKLAAAAILIAAL
jgi:hypothetical protein